MTGTDIVRMRLAALTAVTALVSTRIYALSLPQTPTLPAIRVALVPGVPESMHLRGRTGVVVERVQVDYYVANTGTNPLGAARAMAAAVYGDMVGGEATGLTGWSGSIGSPATTVDLIEPASQQVEAGAQDELRQTIVSQDYYVHYRT